MASFLSTYDNKVDAKGRVSVPAAFRDALGDAVRLGLAAYPSPFEPTIEAQGRALVDELNSKRREHLLSHGDFERVLIGDGSGDSMDLLMELAFPLSFDSEGRITLPAQLLEHAGIADRAVFVGRGLRFQIWSPENHRPRLESELERLRAGAGSASR